VSERRKNIRNVLIVLLLATIVWGVPGGDTASATISNLLSVILLAGLLFFAYRLYMEHRTTLFDLPENHRAILYGSSALAVITIVATSRIWDAGGVWVLLWFALLGAAAYGFATVIRAWRQSGLY
jgi:hypothetical protein